MTAHRGDQRRNAAAAREDRRRCKATERSERHYEMKFYCASHAENANRRTAGQARSSAERRTTDGIRGSLFDGGKGRGLRVNL